MSRLLNDKDLSKIITEFHSGHFDQAVISKLLSHIEALNKLINDLLKAKESAGEP